MQLRSEFMAERQNIVVSEEEMAQQRNYIAEVKKMTGGGKYKINTYGCQMNEHDSELLAGMLTEMGYAPTESDEEADVILFNTCCVRDNAERRVSGNIGALAGLKRSRPDLVIGVCGCYAQSSPDEIRKLDVDVLIGTDGREAFVRHMIDAAQTRQKWDCVDDAGGPRAFEILPAGGLAARTRALLKVEDGCNNFCTYCIIPYARGRVRSMPLEAAVAQATGLAAEGYREIVINGIEISSWGWEWKDGSCLRQLLAALCEAVPGVRIRLGSLEPRTIDEAFCKTLSGYPNLCPQFHLSLQSGSDTVLKRMHRKYDTARYLESVRLLRQYFPGCAVTTDLIVGFPGETEEEFEDTLSLIEEVRYDALFTFIFSPRAGTPAAKMDDPTPKEEKNRRFDRLCDTQNRISLEIHQGYVGRTLRVLVDGREKEMLTARTEGGRLVRFAGDDSLIGQFLDVTITGCTTWSLVGEVK